MLLPPGWNYRSCVTDKNPAQRALGEVALSDSSRMTVEHCVYHCNNNYNNLAGLENGKDCYCGNATTNGASTAPDSDCNIMCAGDASENCGGTYSLGLYWNGQ